MVDEIDGSTSLLQDVGYNTAPPPIRSTSPGSHPTTCRRLRRALYCRGQKAWVPREKGAPALLRLRALTPAGGKQVSAVHIDFPLDVTSWTWDPKTGRWLRSYSDTGPAVQGDNVVISAANVVDYCTSSNTARRTSRTTRAPTRTSSSLTGTGPAWIFRNGVEFTGTWKRPSLSQPAIFKEADGTTITLTPGNTWEELVPDAVDGDGLGCQGTREGRLRRDAEAGHGRWPTEDRGLWSRAQ